MTFNKKQKTNFNKNWAAILVLSAVLSCYPVLAEEANYSYFNPTEIEPIRIANQIYLDTSQTGKFTPNTSIPFNLRQFSEADYFSSTIDDSLPVSQNSPPIAVENKSAVIDLDNLPSPSQFKDAKNKPVEVVKSLPAKNNTVPEAGFIDNGFAPVSSANSFFAPVTDNESQALPVESVQAVVVEKSEQHTEETVSQDANTKPTLREILADDKQEEKKENYFAKAKEEQVDLNSDLEGRSISTITFEGLKAIDEELILAEINMQPGALFSQGQIQQDLQKIYSLGFFSDEMSVEPTLRPDGDVDLHYSLKENIIVKDVSIIGNTVVSASELKPFITSMKGLPQNLNKINESINKITTYYHDKGYILASISSVDDDEYGNLNLTLNEGVINKIDIKGNERTQDFIIERNILSKPGSVYNEEYLKKDLAKVFSTQMFEKVDREITPSEDNQGTYDVFVVVQEKVTNSIGFGGGIDTGLGAFGSITFKEDNFRGRGQRLALTGLLGSGILLSDASIKNRMNYQAELSLFEPHFLNSDNSLMSRLYFREMGSWQIPLAIERRIGLSSTIEHKIKDYENFSTTFTLGAEHINLKEGDLNSITQMYNRYNLNIAERARQLEDGFFIHLAPGLKYTNVDDIEVPRDGVMAQLKFNEAIGVTDFGHTNGRLSGAITKFFPVFKKSTFSLTGKAGVKIHGNDMPEIMAYRLGGPYSIRGYKMNGVGSGESFVMGSAELATPLPFVDKLKWDVIKKIRLTFFVDAGSVFDPTISSYLYDRPLHALTAGVGLRLFIPGLGPISVDYGLPLTNCGDYGSENGYFTFGTGGLNMYNY